MNTILFDLDGTLLPMELHAFEKMYFKTLCGTITEIEPERLMKNIWIGTNAMLQNDGSKTNKEAFCDVFYQLNDMDVYASEERLLKYYENEFQMCVGVCNVTSISKEIVSVLKEKGYRVAIATNPIFPQIATYSRLKWLGLSPEEFELVTTYEDSHYTKPNLDYYREICNKLQVNPKDCVMIGNDVVEDGCAAKLGMDVKLVTDCIITHECPTDGIWMGTLKEVLEWAKQLPCRV